MTAGRLRLRVSGVCIAMVQNSSEREKLTRKSRIDPRLDRAGWPLRRGGAGPCRIEEYDTSAGPADYALKSDGRVVGVVEAKKLTVGPRGVLSQAERYSKGAPSTAFNFAGYHVPFIYSTNGELIWFRDVRSRTSVARRLAGFHTPQALEELLSRNTSAEFRKLHALANDHPALRPYQKEANAAIESAMRKGSRAMLVAMATGTGKTFTIVNELYRLLKSGVARRILFLVDRRALAAQAVRAFSSFTAEGSFKFDQVYPVYSQRFHKEDLEDEPFDPRVLPTEYLTAPSNDNPFVYVCTIQRMAMNILGEAALDAFSDDIEIDAEQLDIPINAFDLIIADECHRGYTSSELSVWRNTLDYFDAVRIGLTATPAAHTLAYFNHVAYRYEYERAVREGYLVDYDKVNIKSDVRMNGVFLEEGQHIGIINPTSGSEQLDILEDERNFSASEVEVKVTSPDSNLKIIQELKAYADEHERIYGRFPKTLIFAANDLPHVSHADQLLDVCIDVFGRGEEFVEKITGRVDRPLQKIKEFRNRKRPGIAISVDLMTTGVDIPDLEFIVFLRPVRSRILFEQMLGRGTRISDNLQDKTHFTVFDCFGGSLFKYFAGATPMTLAPPERSARTIVDIIEDIWNNKDFDYDVSCLVKRLRRVSRDVSAQGRSLFAKYIEHGDVGAFAESLPSNLKVKFGETMQLLRTRSFQQLLMDYPRKEKLFIKAYEVTDSVTSEMQQRDGDISFKPADYLKQFAAFVKHNKDKIDALKILLARPKDWSPEVLEHLLDALRDSPERFSLSLLQEAHELSYNKGLVDIISMVKHAYAPESPLLNAYERVDAALERVIGGRTLTDKQSEWLSLIREHLVQNLALEERDFDEFPIFSRAGGAGKARRLFGEHLRPIIAEINEAVAA